MTRGLRISTGMVLFVFVATHMVNLSFGLISIDMMDRARGPLMAPWTNILGEIVLFASLLVHGVLGLSSLYLRGTLRMSRADAVQYIAGLLIVPLLVTHVVGTVFASRQFGIVPSYSVLIDYFWIYAPLEGLRQVLLVVVVWIHGCVGIFTWLRLQIWWNRLAPFFYPLAVALPVLALLGFAQAGNDAITPPPLAETQTIQTDAATPEPVVSNPVTPEIIATLAMINKTTVGLYLLLVVLVLLARALRLRRRQNVVQVSYLKGPRIEQDSGPSLLELATIHNVPHASLCRGRGRCGTCQVRIVEHSQSLPDPNEIEQQTLQRVHAAADVRLACQLVPQGGSLVIERLLPPYLRPADLKPGKPEISTSADPAEPVLP